MKTEIRSQLLYGNRNRPFKKCCTLRYNTDFFTEIMLAVGSDILPIHQNRSLCDIVKTCDQVDESGFATAQLGEAYAQSMGVNIKIFRVTLILLSSVLSATVTAFAGPISFVGIAVPHLVKQALNTSRPLIVVPGTFLGGAVFCMLSDLIARTAFAPLELNISTVTSIFGAPVVIAMMLKRQKGRQ